uniref:Uncharacterized protein n=1 Tax=Anopheles coluzzii TaxID=1518534 RepID=A0A8W7PSP0_ANOCL
MTPSSRQTVRTLAFSVGGGRVGTDGAVITFLVQALVCGKLREERMPQSLVCKDGLRPAELEDHFRCAIVPGGDDGAVVLVVKRGAAKIDQSNIGTVDAAHLAVLLRKRKGECKNK